MGRVTAQHFCSCLAILIR